MIWERALPGPRVVHIRQRKLKKTIGEWETETGKKWPVLGSSETDPDLDSEYEDSDDEYFERFLSEDAVFRERQRALMRYCIDADVYDDDGYKKGHLLGIYSEHPFPGLLYACRESYGVVSKSYTKSFWSLGSMAQTWFNFNTDTLYLRYDTFSYYQAAAEGTFSLGDELQGGNRILDTENLRKVKKLAVLLDTKHQEGPEGWLLGVLQAFGNVEELSMVLDHVQDENGEGEENEVFIT